MIRQLQHHNIDVVAVANPLRGLTFDSRYVAAIVQKINTPVLLVGHSYGGAVISNATGLVSNVVGLVYVAAYIPEVGESLRSLTTQSKKSILGPATEVQANGDIAVKISEFPAVFAADLDSATANVMAVSQRPGTPQTFDDVSQIAAWKTMKPASLWAIVATEDKAVGTDVVMWMAERANAQITEISASHAVPVSQPGRVAKVILSAVQSLNV